MDNARTETEAEWWAGLQVMHEKEDQELLDQYGKRHDEVMERLGPLFQQRAELEKKLQEIVEKCNAEEQMLDDMEQAMEEAKKARAAERARQRAYMEAFFRGDNGRSAPGIAASGTKLAAGTISPLILANARPVRPGVETGATIHYWNTNQAASVRRLRFSNSYIEALLDLPIRRPVALRRRGQIDAAELVAVNEPSDQRATHWMGAMIQATGELNEHNMCTNCAGGLGPFAHCIVVRDARGMFPRCGNCEWIRQSCYQPQGIPPAVMPKAEPLAQDAGVGLVVKPYWPAVTQDTPPPRPPPKVLPEITQATLTLRHDGVVYTHPECMAGVPVDKIAPGHPYWDAGWTDPRPAIHQAWAGWAKKVEQAALEPLAGHGNYNVGRQANRGEKMLRFLDNPNSISPYQLLAKKYVTPSLCAYDTLYRLVQTLEDLGGMKLDVTPLDWLRQRLAELVAEQGEERFSLATTVHRFYADDKLAALRAKNGVSSIGRPTGSKGAAPGGGSGSGAGPGKRGGEAAWVDGTPTKAKKQKVVRGGPGTGNGSELASAEFAASSTAVVVAATTTTTSTLTPPVGANTLPNRPAVAANGTAQSPPPPAAALAQAALLPPRSSPGVTNTVSSALIPTTANTTRAATPNGAASTAAPVATITTITTTAAAATNEQDYTDVESACGEELGRTDWRIESVKTRLYASCDRVRQYWHWDDDLAQFQHQLLRVMTPPTAGGGAAVVVASWGQYDDVDFDVQAVEIQCVRWSSASLRVWVVMREGAGVGTGGARIEGEDGQARGDVMALFARPRTRKRFLRFCREKGLALAELPSSDIDKAWDAMQSENQLDEQMEEDMSISY